MPELAQQLQVQAVFANHDDEPAAHARDAQVLGALAHAGIMFHGYKDQVIFERREVLTQAGHPFGVFTPYKNAWLKRLTDDPPHAASGAPRTPHWPRARQRCASPCPPWPPWALSPPTWRS